MSLDRKLNRRVHVFPVTIVRNCETPRVAINIHHVVCSSIKSLLEVTSCFRAHLVPDGPEELAWFLLVCNTYDGVDLNIVVAEVID